MHGFPWFWNLSQFELTLLVALIFISACIISDKLGVNFWDLAGKPNEYGKYSFNQHLFRVFLFLNLLLFTLIIMSVFL